MRKGLLNLTMEETVKLLGMIVITAFVFALVTWGVGHVETLGKYFGVGSPNGDIRLVNHGVDGGIFTATVTVSNTADKEQEVWVEMTGSNPSATFSTGPSSYDLDRHPSEGSMALTAGEKREGITLSGSHRNAGCAVEIRLEASCGPNLLCTGERVLDSVTVRLPETVGVHSEWRAECG